ncbi:MAG: sigma-70 family RNA polymerase sigma factor [Bryobacteraceae bacterium]|nr:sigma-70 family RNA polymerase sigma factor [Bryobacteraceae bacterium]
MQAEHERLVLRTAYRLLGRWEDAQDAAQEVFLRRIQANGSLDPARPIEPWLYRVTVNVCRDRYRRHRPGAELPDLRDTALDPEALALLEEQRRVLHRAIERLPRRERTAVTLKYLDGLEDGEIAARLGIGEGTVRANLSTGRARLKRLVAAAIGASVGVLVWVSWPKANEVAPPAAIVAKFPAADMTPSATPLPARPRPKPPVKSEPLLVRLESADESVVIYWWIESKGDENE